jgi:trehalose 6-phosphate synthase
VQDDIVLVSNRGPVSFVVDDGHFEITRGAGGLSAALDNVARRLGDHAVWIAAATSDEDRKAVEAGVTDRLQAELGYPVRLLSFDPDVYDRYYNVVSNRMLWFANHCLWDELGIKEFGSAEVAAWSEAYQPVNVRFAKTVVEVAAPDALVLFQDYHLATAPGHLRELGDEHVIGHFTHSSFCGPEGLDRLPRPIPRRVIHGMLGADLLGFHVAAWVGAFFECSERAGASVDRSRGTVEYRARTTWVRAYPIPIDPRDLQKRARGEAACRWGERFASEGGLLLVRADRAEPSKNIIRGFEAFGLVLDRRADLRERLRFIACLYPSRESMPEYQAYMDDIFAVVDKVNAGHPDAIDLYMEDDYDRTLGALRVYDGLLVNSIMDGMNLVSKEGPAVNENAGALILTTTTGSHEELGEYAIEIHDPFDVEATADAIERALDLPPEERRRRAQSLRKLVESRLPDDWIEAQLDDLSEIAEGRAPRTPPAKV